MGRKRKPKTDDPRQMLLDLGLSKPVERRHQAVIGHARFGVLRSPVFIEDIDRLVAPTGEGAQDAFERDLSMMEAELDSDSDGPGLNDDFGPF